MQTVYTWEQIGAKLDWEGFPDGLEWFTADQVPEEGRDLWRRLLSARRLLAILESELNEYLPDV